MERLIMLIMPLLLFVTSVLLLAVIGSYLWDIFGGEPRRDR
jgi:hypothetical protein